MLDLSEPVQPPRVGAPPGTGRGPGCEGEADVGPAGLGASVGLRAARCLDLSSASVSSWESVSGGAGASSGPVAGPGAGTVDWAAAGRPLAARFLEQVLPARPAVMAVGADDVARTRAAAEEEAVGVLRHQWKDEGQRLVRAMEEFARWLQVYGQGRTPYNCSSWDVLVYMQGYWLQHHRARHGGGLPSPSSVDGVLSALTTAFAQLGRGGPYQEETGQGNPCSSVDVVGYRTRYRKRAEKQGVAPGGAVPMTEDKVRSLSRWLVEEALRLPEGSVGQLVRLRDRAVFLLMWATAMRGHDCGKLRLTDFRDPEVKERPYDWGSLPALGVGGAYPSEVELCIWELGDKTHQTGRADPYYLGSSDTDVLLCPVRGLAVYYHACQAQAGTRLGGYLFRACSSDRRSFQETAMSSPGLGGRLKKYLAEAKQLQGESCHSFRRGMLQAAAKRGADMLELMALGHMKALSTLKRYLEPRSHLRRVVAVEAWAEEGGEGL